MASMGPQRFRRGDASFASSPTPTVAASMGPQRFRRGDDEGIYSICRFDELQWGRNVSVAEITEFVKT